jgi:hypothetical protein
MMSKPQYHILLQVSEYTHRRELGDMPDLSTDHVDVHRENRRLVTVWSGYSLFDSTT